MDAAAENRAFTSADALTAIARNGEDISPSMVIAAAMLKDRQWNTVMEAAESVLWHAGFDTDGNRWSRLLDRIEANKPEVV